MKKIVALLLLFTAIGNCSAQYSVKKVQAFFTVSMPGMAMQDEQGNTIDPQPVIERFIYIECRFNGKPTIDSVFYNGILFTPAVAAKEETTTRIGINAATGKPVNLLPKKGNHIWKIDVEQPNGKTLKHQAVKKILIKGKLGKMKFSYTLTAETKLTTPDRY
jgi:hypothetical protein